MDRLSDWTKRVALRVQRSHCFRETQQYFLCLCFDTALVKGTNTLSLNSSCISITFYQNKGRQLGKGGHMSTCPFYILKTLSDLKTDQKKDMHASDF